MAALNATAVEQDVDAVAIFKDLWDESVDRGGRGEVGCVDCCFAAEGLDGLFGGLVGFVTLPEGGLLDGLSSPSNFMSSLTWTSRTSAPDSANAIAIDWPIPLVPPVTRAVLPSKLNSCWTDDDIVFDGLSICSLSCSILSMAI